MTYFGNIIMPDDIRPDTSIEELETIRKEWWDAACDRDIQHSCLIAALLGSEQYRYGRRFMVRSLRSVVVEKTDTSVAYNTALGMITRNIVVSVYRIEGNVRLGHFCWEHLDEDDNKLFSQVATCNAVYSDDSFVIPGEWWLEVSRYAQDAIAKHNDEIEKEQEAKRVRLLRMLRPE